MLTVTNVPTETIQAMLREHLADPSAHLTDLEAEPIVSDGYSGNELQRLRLAWSSRHATDKPRTAAWVLKRWLPGGHAEHLLGIHRPLEALSWQAGLVSPAALPAGVTTPMVAARLDPDGRAAWIAMEDVSPELARYSREAPLPPAEALARARQILDRLARFHTWWERPDRQATLRRCPWLVPMERFLWCDAASCATVLGKVPPPGLAPGREVTDEYRANIKAVLAWMPAGDRPLFERLFCDRTPLVSALSVLPRTLIHGDVGDRNVGLRQRPAGAATDDASDLVLIDWEWIGYGTPALDVVHLCASFPGLIDPAESIPDAAFTDELPSYYFERYCSYGGTLTDVRTWRRAYSLMMLDAVMSQLSFVGTMIRYDVTRVVSALGRQFDTLAVTARSLDYA
jgi:phosphotransferase family enzyme